MWRQKQLLDRLEKMLEDGINGTFEESDYDETRLSRLEAKWLRYLASSRQSYRNTQKEREKLQELVSDISHQTKTPLANILLYTQLLQEHDLDDACGQLVDQLRQQSEKLHFLIQSLVKVSRLETGTLRLAPAICALDPVIRSAIAQLAPLAHDKAIRVRYTPTDYTARLDAKWTREALCNLLDNAVKYSPPGSEIAVTVRAYELFVCVSVADSGTGLTEEELPRVFGRFYRGQNATTQNGVGLGLYLCRQILEGQGGYITATSAPGRGSDFQIYLPRQA